MEFKKILGLKYWVYTLKVLFLLIFFQNCTNQKFSSSTKESSRSFVGEPEDSQTEIPIEDDPVTIVSVIPQVPVVITEGPQSPTTASPAEMTWTKVASQVSAKFLEANGLKAETFEFVGGSAPYSVSSQGFTPNWLSLDSIGVDALRPNTKVITIKMNTALIFQVSSAVIKVTDAQGKILTTSFSAAVVANARVGQLSIAGPTDIEIDQCVRYTITSVKILGGITHDTNGAANCYNSQEGFYGISWNSLGIKTYKVSAVDEGANPVEGNIQVLVKAKAVTAVEEADYFIGPKQCVIPRGSAMCAIRLLWENSKNGPRMAQSLQFPRGLDTTQAGSYDFSVGSELQISQYKINNNVATGGVIRTLSAICENTQDVKDALGHCVDRNDPAAGRCGALPLWGSGSGFYLNDNPNNTYVTLTCYPTSVNSIANKVGDAATTIQAGGSGVINNGYWYAGYGTATISCQYINTIPQWVILQSGCRRNP